MKSYFFFLTLLFSVVSCIQHGEIKHEIQDTKHTDEQIVLKYAKGFDVDYLDGYIKIVTHSLEKNDSFRDSLYLITSANAEVPEGVKKLGYGDHQFACQSSTYLAYFNSLDEIDLVSGLCGIHYVVDPELKSILANNQVKEICPSDQLEIEALHGANPALVLVYPFGGDDQDVYTKQGLQSLLIAEYLEESQLARLEWIKLFGLLTGEVEKANAYFEQVEADYLNLKKLEKTTGKTFIMNLPFDDEWYMPSSKSVGVQLIEDAGLAYFYGGELGTENKLHSKEEVWNDGVEADYWLILARLDPDYSLAKLVAESPVYETFKSVKEKNVIICNTATSDYFVKGVVEPNLILKDLLYATGQLENHTPVYFFRLQ